MLLSTLRDYIGKMGGELVLTARFPDREPVKIKGFTDIAGGGARSARRSSRTAAVRPRRLVFNRLHQMLSAAPGD